MIFWEKRYLLKHILIFLNYFWNNVTKLRATCSNTSHKKKSPLWRNNDPWVLRLNLYLLVLASCQWESSMRRRAELQHYAPWGSIMPRGAASCPGGQHHEGGQHHAQGGNIMKGGSIMPRGATSWRGAASGPGGAAQGGSIMPGGQHHSQGGSIVPRRQHHAQGHTTIPKKSSMARGSIMPGVASHGQGEQHAQGEQHTRGSSIGMMSSITRLCITYLHEIEGNFVLWKTESQRAVVRDLLYTLTLARQTIDWFKRATYFPYFLHNEFGGFTASKLLD